VALFYAMVMDVDKLGEEGRDKYKGKLVVNMGERGRGKVEDLVKKYNLKAEIVEDGGEAVDLGERMYEKVLEMRKEADGIKQIYEQALKAAEVVGDGEDKVEEYLNEEDREQVKAIKAQVDGLMGVLFMDMPLLFEGDLRIDENNLRVGDDLRREIDENLRERFGGLTEAPVSVEEWERRKNVGRV